MKTVSAVILAGVVLMVGAENVRAETKGVKGKVQITGKDRKLQAEVWYAKGQKYIGAKEFEAAKDALTKAISLSPTYINAYLNRAIVYEKMGQYDKSIEDYSKAISLDSKDAYSFDERGTMYRKMGHYDRAIEDYTRALSLDPDCITLLYDYNNRALAYFKMGRSDKAIEDYTKTISLYENEQPASYAIVLDTYNDRGVVYYNIGEFDKAIKDFKMACELGSQAGCENARIIPSK